MATQSQPLFVSPIATASCAKKESCSKHNPPFMLRLQEKGRWRLLTSNTNETSKILSLGCHVEACEALKGFRSPLGRQEEAQNSLGKCCFFWLYLEPCEGARSWEHAQDTSQMASYPHWRLALDPNLNHLHLRTARVVHVGIGRTHSLSLRQRFMRCNIEKRNNKTKGFYFYCSGKTRLVVS